MKLKFIIIFILLISGVSLNAYSDEIKFENLLWVLRDTSRHFPLNANSDEIKFEKGSFAEVLALAKEQNKIVMIDLYTDWCKWCVELDNFVYTDPEVAKFANENQINWKIDAEKGEGPDLAQKYNVSGYPTIIFVDYLGTEVDRIVGYFPAAPFLKLMKEIVDGSNSMITLKRKLVENPNDIEANFKFAEKVLNYGNSEEAKTYFRKVMELDKDNQSGYADDAELYNAMFTGKSEEIEKWIQKFPNSNMLKLAYSMVAETAFMENNDYLKARKYYDLAFEKFGRNDDELNFSYTQFLLTKMYSVYKNEKAAQDDIKATLKCADECLTLVKGSINEGSVYYYQSEFYMRLGDFDNAIKAIDGALAIHNKKTYQEQKDKILKKRDSK